MLAAALLIAGLSALPALAAAPPAVSLGTSAGYARRTAALCGAKKVRHSYAYFHRGTRIVFHGSVRPAPRLRIWHVFVRVKRCIGTKSSQVRKMVAVRRPNGLFQAVYVARLAGVYTVRAYYELPGRQRVRGHKWVASGKRWLVVH